MVAMGQINKINYEILIRASCRGLFVISDKGIVRHASVNDVEVGRSVNEIHRLVVGFQYTDKNGEGGLHLDQVFLVVGVLCFRQSHLWIIE